MFDFISWQLEKNGIDLLGKLPLDECKLTRPYLLEKAGIKSGTAILFAVPYLIDDGKQGNLSEYAKSRDYHLFFKKLFEETLPLLQGAFPNNKFIGFTDHSPIDEIAAAAKSGIGIIGSNGLLITEKYSSFVFIGEIITDAELECNVGEIKVCENCGLCKSLCPARLCKAECLSAITQKKGTLSPSEIELMQRNNTVWGCDICQSVCPHTQKAIKNGTIYSNIDFFKVSRTPYITYETIRNMSDEDFKSRAYSWRGKDVILRNLELFQSNRLLPEEDHTEG